MHQLLLRIAWLPLLATLVKALLVAAGVFWLTTVTLHLVPPLGRLVRRLSK